MTHFLRIEVPTGFEENPLILLNSEVNAFANIIYERSEGNIILPGEGFYGFYCPEKNTDLSIEEINKRNAGSALQLFELSKLHRIFCNIVDAHLHRDNISAKNDEFLTEDFESIFKYSRLTFMPPGLNWDNERGVTLGYVPRGGKFGFLARGVHLLLEEFYDTLDNGLLLPCQECKQGFAGLKPGQRFCSHRCAHREGSRRRYAKKPGAEDSDTKK